MSAYKCIVWGLGKDYNQLISILKHYMKKGNIEIMGVTANQDFYSVVDGYTYIKPENIMQMNFDFIIVASIQKFLEIKKDILKLNISEDKILSMKIFFLPEFDLEKYLQVKMLKISIFAINCWGGLTYNQLGLEFMSPFINMSESVGDYIKIMKNPKFYLESTLQFKCNGIEPHLKTMYPICQLEDVDLHFNHYASYEQAKELWDKRKQRINWDNLFLMMYTKDYEEATKFIELPYDNKICFVPFETNEKDLMYVDFYRNCDGIPFWEIVLGMATGQYVSYDVLSLLLGDKRKRFL